jgi:hypothetical protein
MKKIILFSSIIHLLSGCQIKQKISIPLTVSKSQKIAPHEIFSKGANNSIQVTHIDWEKGKIAYKVFYRRLYMVKKTKEDEPYDHEFDYMKEAPLIDCKYPGVPAGSAQVMAIYDVGGDAVEIFNETHKSVQKREDCSRPAEIKIKVEAIEKAMQAYKFQTIEESQIFSLPGSLSDGGKKYDLTYKSRQVKEHEYEELGLSDRIREITSDGISSAYFTVGEVFISGKIFYQRPHEDYFAMASYTDISFPKVFVKDDKVILLEYFNHITHDGESENDIWYSFSPVMTFN